MGGWQLVSMWRWLFEDQWGEGVGIVIRWWNWCARADLQWRWCVLFSEMEVMLPVDTVLGCKHQRSLVTSVSSPKTPLRHSSIDFHEDFGSPPQRFSNQVTRCSFGKGTKPSALRGDEDGVSVCYPLTDLSDKLLLGEASMVRLSWNLLYPNGAAVPLFSFSMVRLHLSLPSQWCGWKSYTHLDIISSLRDLVRPSKKNQSDQPIRWSKKCSFSQSGDDKKNISPSGHPPKNLLFSSPATVMEDPVGKLPFSDLFPLFLNAKIFSFFPGVAALPSRESFPPQWSRWLYQYGKNPSPV